MRVMSLQLCYLYEGKGIVCQLLRIFVLYRPTIGSGHFVCDTSNRVITAPQTSKRTIFVA